MSQTERPFVIQLAGSADKARGIIGPALSILLKWHLYDSWWLCASECITDYAFDKCIDAYVNGEYKNASHLVIDVEKSKYASALHSKYKTRNLDENAHKNNDMTDNEQCTLHKELNFPVSCTIYVEEKELESAEVHVDNNDKNKSNNIANDVEFCEGNNAEMQLMSQEKNVVRGDDNAKKDKNVSTFDKQFEEQKTTEINQANNLYVSDNAFDTETAKKVAKCDEATIKDDRVNVSQGTKTGTAEEILHNPSSPYKNSDASPPHMFVRVEVIYNTYNDGDLNEKQSFVNVSNTEQKNDINATRSNKTIIHHYNVMINETAAEEETASTSPESAHMPPFSTPSRNQYKEEQEQLEYKEVQRTKRCERVACNDIVDVIKCIWKELRKFKCCDAVINRINDRNKHSRWSKDRKFEYEKWKENYYYQMIKRAVRLSQEYENLLSDHYSGEGRYSLPVYTCIAFDNNECEKIKNIIPQEELKGKMVQSEFHMTTRFFGGSRERVGCDDPLMFILLHKFKEREISVKLEAIVSDCKGVAIVVNKLERENPLYDYYDGLYNVNMFDPNKVYDNSQKTSSEISTQASPLTNKICTEVECMTVAEQNVEVQQKESFINNNDKISNTYLPTHERKGSNNCNTINSTTINKKVGDDEIKCIPFICSNATPHITIANARGVKPVHSNILCKDWTEKLYNYEKEIETLPEESF